MLVLQLRVAKEAMRRQQQHIQELGQRVSLVCYVGTVGMHSPDCRRLS